MPHTLTLLGSSALSAFRSQRLLDALQKQGLPIAGIQARYEHFVWLHQSLTTEQQNLLSNLLDYGVPLDNPSDEASSIVLRVLPRLGTVSAWASKATDIAHNCGLSEVHRIERGVRYSVT